MNKIIEVYDLGSKDYKETWDLQEELFSQVLKIKSDNNKTQNPISTPNTLLLVEHPPVFTLGKSGHQENLLISQQHLNKIEASFYKINRGGDITYHGPGQLVGYPILDLENFFTDIHRYLRFLEEAVIMILADYGVKGERSEGETGVWIEPNSTAARKICAIGVRASRWVTMHGFAFNVFTDLSYFDYIIPCGIRNKGVTSLVQEIGFSENKEWLLKEVKEKFQKYFALLLEATTIKKTEIFTSVH